MGINKEEVARRAGMAYAYKVLIDAIQDQVTAEEAIEKLRQEMMYRNITTAPLSITKAQMKEFCDDVRKSYIAGFKCITLLTLLDEFGFGDEELDRFEKRFNTKCECIADDYATWKDYQEILEDECHRRLNLPDGFITK